MTLESLTIVRFAMSHIAQDVLAAVFNSLTPEFRDIVRALTKSLLRLPMAQEEREGYVAGFILHAAEAQAKARNTERESGILPVCEVERRDSQIPLDPIVMRAGDAVHELVRSEPPPPSVPRGRASGEN